MICWKLDPAQFCPALHAHAWLVQGADVGMLCYEKRNREVLKPPAACMCAQVQSGVARTGKWWGHQQVTSEAENVQPDIMIFAKGIASGFPFAGLATRDHIFDVRALIS
jgi:adenosylmethionine-8-amino-7-oxononanoate aminotransferase